MNTINLTVKNQLGETVPDALITDGKTNFYTDILGNAEVKTDASQIKIYAAGHADKTVDLLGISGAMDVTLTKNSELQEVEITAERTNKKNMWLLLVLVLILFHHR